MSTCLQAELQHQLEVRGLDKSGDKEQLANRLLESLIAQVCLLWLPGWVRLLLLPTAYTS